MEVSIICRSIVEDIVSSSVAIAEKRKGVFPHQEINCPETQEHQKQEEKEIKMDNKGT